MCLSLWQLPLPSKPKIVSGRVIVPFALRGPLDPWSEFEVRFGAHHSIMPAPFAPLPLTRGVVHLLAEVDIL